MSYKCAILKHDKTSFQLFSHSAPKLQQGKLPTYKGLPMYIFGLKCVYCSHALESLGIENGVLSTKCSHCGHVSRPKHKDLSKNTVYSRFANKTVEVQYSAKHSRSGEYRRASIINENESHPDRKKFA